MKIVFFSSALLAAGTAIGATPIGGWYSSVFGGANYLPANINLTHYDFKYSHTSYDIGYEAGLRLGFQNYAVRYEGEFTYLNANLKKIAINDILTRDIGGSNQAVFVMANLYYDLPDMVDAVSPFISAGLGYGWIRANIGYEYFGNFINYSQSSQVFAYQGSAGFTYNFFENYAFTIAYRYIGTNRAEAFGKIFRAHLATVGILYRFNENCYK